MAKAKAAAKTTNESRAAKLAQGWAQKGLLLPPQALRDLATVVKRDGCGEAEAVGAALAVLARGDGPAAIPNAKLLRILGQRLRPEFD